MVGRGRPRKRAPSVSTVATIDDSSIRFIRESAVLKPVPPHVSSDDWPCFLLTDAVVYHRNGSMANLLHVDLEGPFVVRGRLEVEKDLQKYLVNRQGKSKRPWIQIDSSTSFSIGQKDDENGLPIPVLWASGQSGWFEIDPSNKYKPIGDVMFQGINLHYNLLVQYEDALENIQKKKQNRGKSFRHVKLPIETLLFNYAVATGDGITLPEARQLCAEQAIFLLSHFPKETIFHRWLADLSPEVVKKFAQREGVPAQPSAEPIHPTLRAASSSLEIPDQTSKVRTTVRASTQRTTRNSETASEEQQHPNGRTMRAIRRSPLDNKPGKADVEMADASDGIPSGSKANSEHRGLPILLDVLNEIRESILELIRQGKNKKHPDQMMPNTLHYRIYLACKVKHRLGGAEICEYYARDLARLLSPEWHQSEFYKWVKANINTKPKFDYSLESECLNLVRRNTRQPKAAAAAEDTGQSSHSSKQPAPPDTAGKQPPKKRGRPSGKAAGLRPSLGGGKRPRLDDDDMDIDDDGSKKMTKKSKYLFGDENEAGSSPAEEEDAGEEEDEEDEDATKDGEPRTLTRLVIRAEKLPSTAPKGPNQTWTCEEPDCGYVVRGADAEDGQNLISAHFAEHEKEARDEAQEDALKRVNLAMQESGGHMPIDHLLEKIRTMGEKTGRRNETKVNGQAVPQPIKRTLLV